MRVWIFFIFLLAISIPAHAVDRFVRDPQDVEGINSLRTILRNACDDAGDDVIHFRSLQGSEFRIELDYPLVIPEDCNGAITLDGTWINRATGAPTVGETLLDFGAVTRRGGSPPCDPSEEDCFYPLPGSDREQILRERLGGFVPGDSCILYVYSNRHTIKNITFVGNAHGAGVCLFGNENRVEENQFQENKYGVVVHDIFSENGHPQMTGGQNIMLNNQIGPSTEHGVWVHADHVSLLQNTIHDTQANTGVVVWGDELRMEGNTLLQNQGYGLYLEGNEAQIKNNQILHNQNQGIHVIGNENGVMENTIEENNGDGLWFQGHEAWISKNTFSQNQGMGLRFAGDDATILENQIVHNTSHGMGVRSFRSQISGNEILSNAGVGLWIEEGSLDLVIGGSDFSRDRNVIQYNHDGGVFVMGDEASVGHFITHNTISRNEGPNIDLGGDGITLNDLLDTDEGPNRLLNTVDYFQVFPIASNPDGTPRYWAWGIALQGTKVEVYSVAEEDVQRGLLYGGGEEHAGDASIDHNCNSNAVCIGTFEVPSDVRATPATIPAGRRRVAPTDSGRATLLTFDEYNNTSEYSWNYGVGPDADLDGILDELETGRRGTPMKDGNSSDVEAPRARPQIPDGWVPRVGLLQGSLPTTTDSDGDGLPDPVEDKNHNGVWDPGETQAYNPDTDGDGLSDGIETHGDGIYDADIDTDPWEPDTDGDGIPDGREDSNHNGIVDAYLRETSPLLTDSDHDGHPDATDTCPSVANPGQEAWYCFF